MQKYLEYFTNYVMKNFDFDNELINRKYYHSLRVATLMAVLGYNLGLDDKDIALAYKIGLCHDLGRFYEVVRNGKFNNKKFDHASYSNKILYNDEFIKYMDIDINDYLLLRKTIYYHNKKDIDNNLSNREFLFTNMLRDMDKVDLLRVRFNGSILKFTKPPTEIVFNCYMEDKTINIKDIHNNTDSTILYLSFIKDLYFDYSFDYVMNEDFVGKLLNIVEMSDENHLLMDELLLKIKERRNKDVREKIRSHKC